MTVGLVQPTNEDVIIADLRRQLKETQKSERETTKHLKGLVANVTLFMRYLDEEMAKPSSPERGGEIAKLANRLNIATDRARFFGLNIDFRTGKAR